MKFDEFVKLATAELQITDNDIYDVKNLKSIIPTDLSEAFEKNPPATTRLISSWEYVNQAPFSSKPNTDMFLKGDRANWALIAAEKYFLRDIEEQIYEDLLDYATSTKDNIKIKILLGPAGYGISTLLMSLASKLVKDRAGAVYMAKPARQILQGDIEYAIGITKGKIFFFIDNASENIENIKTITQRLKETKKDALFILGGRLNEWRQSSVTVSGNEFQIEPLSDPEIDRLLDYLGENSALNKLEYLPRDLQFSAIKKNYNQELLIAMREATEDERFDAIIESEYRGIRGEKAKDAYLITCCFYLHGTYIRDSLLAELIGVEWSEFAKIIGSPTDGVIIFDEIDQSKKIFGARARHRKIAEIVWERCANQSVKPEIIQKVLDKLNLNFSVDAKSFENFYRSDHLVDSIGSLEMKIDFFEKARKKDPRSPYISQHYSRMLLREDKPDLALSEIEVAMGQDNKKVFYHTKGIILSKIAMEAESEEIGRRRLAQAENCFKNGINANPRNDYFYQGLSELYLNWASRCKASSESIDYIEKAEAVVGEGLSKARLKDSLWMTSAKINDFLGNNPKYNYDMRQAITEKPSNIIARYLLGRTFRKSGEFKEALDVLEYVIKNNSEEYRSFVEYALCLYHLGKPLKECIAILYQSTLYGYSDPRFIATLGGILFMDGQFSEAERVFNESNNRNFTHSELNTIQFIPIDPKRLDKPKELEGVVVTVKAGYCWIISEGYPNFLCPGSKYKGLIMKEGLKLKFEPAFNPKGHIAINPNV